jgi:hypothetical protein
LLLSAAQSTRSRDWTSGSISRIRSIDQNLATRQENRLEVAVE